MDMLLLVGDGSVPSYFMEEIQMTLSQFPFIASCMFTSAINPGHTDCTPVGTIFQLAMFMHEFLLKCFTTEPGT